MSDNVREAFEKASDWLDNPENSPFLPRNAFMDAHQAATAAADAEWRGVVEKLVGLLTIAQEAAECFPDVHDGRVEPLQIIEHLHEWESKYITFGNVEGVDKALAQAQQLLGRK